MTTSSGWHRVNRNTRASRQRQADYSSKAHRDERARRVAASTPHTPCTYCGRPLGPDRSRWILAHTVDRRGYMPGLSCKRCNDLEAQRRGGSAALAKRQGRRPPLPRAAVPRTPAPQARRDDWYRR